jgi:selenocysteine lyase/cysteine desulfurase
MNRRHFVQLAATAAAPRAFSLPPALPVSSAAREADFVELRKRHFLLDDDCAFLNTGTLGVMPCSVVDAFAAGMHELASEPGVEHRRWGYEPLLDLRTELAAQFGCSADELAITHNSTYGLNTIASGVKLCPGDEVLLTSLEHRSNLQPWLVRQKRSGIVVRTVRLPMPLPGIEELGSLIIDAIGPKVRVVAFSGIFSWPGSVTPVRRICQAARDKGVLTLVDGAHMPGQVNVNLHELGCDFWVGSPHKWMFTPPGCGLLYVRHELLDRIWPCITAGDWDDPSIGAQRFMMVGTNNLATIRGYSAGLAFFRALGPDAIYARIRQLSAHVYKELSSLPQVRLVQADGSFAGMVVGALTDHSRAQRLAAVAERRKLIVSGAGSPMWRISTHVHTRLRDLDLLFDTLRNG